jgi:integrase/recombinase XerC
LIIIKFIEYLKVEKGYSKHTLIAYENDLNSFNLHLISNDAEADLIKANYSQIRNWIVNLSETDIEHRSINRKISSLKSFYKFLLKTGLIEKNPLDLHRSLKTQKKILLPFSQKEMENLHDLYSVDTSYNNVRDSLILELLYTTGIRRFELINLQLTDVNLNDKQIKVLGKRNKERYIPLIDSTISIIENYLEIRKDINTSCKNLILTQKGQPLYDSIVYKIVNKYMSMVSSKEQRSPHVLRHAFATHLLDEGSDLNTVKELLGHSSLASTQVYTHSSLERLKEVYRKSHPRNK